ncbi:hypothetical protein KIH31_01225 [Paenarthrobacter sp. DKR-5]|uniref:hypothetical protein n=1 Tax=Paenarthrobacter sp. DKR-5 TaxID=2835535 RepID=UPI001BDC60B0|nr:hypothetical protein [Paenarthrobacter sp. DKR-5]MBT1001209.1 hypothetical protein [Paenarthrobacter sp. DKR-5]
MSEAPLPQRAFRAVGMSALSERVAAAQEFVHGPVIAWARRSPLHKAVLGHSVHPERRIGAVHALGTDISVFLLLGSLVARIRGSHRVGVRLGLAGNTVAAGAGLLGGHLAFNRGTGRRTAGAA